MLEEDLTEDEYHKKKMLIRLEYDAKSSALTTILLLKSGFSVIDQIFQEEISLAEINRRKCFSDCCMAPMKNVVDANKFEFTNSMCRSQACVFQIIQIRRSS